MHHFLSHFLQSHASHMSWHLICQSDMCSQGLSLGLDLFFVYSIVGGNQTSGTNRRAQIFLTDQG